MCALFAPIPFHLHRYDTLPAIQPNWSMNLLTRGHACMFQVCVCMTQPSLDAHFHELISGVSHGLQTQLLALADQVACATSSNAASSALG